MDKILITHKFLDIFRRIQLKYFISFFFLVNFPDLQAQVSLGDFIALRDFYNATQGDTWTNRTGWENINTTATPASVNSTWYGLNVSGNRVRRIEMTNNNLNGTLPSTISLLTGLTRLTLINEPNLTGIIPTSIGSLTALTDLRINQTGMSGNLPQEIGNLSNLVFLFLIENDFSGTLPTTIGNLSNLISFIIPFNNFSGDLPTSAIDNLDKLTEFRIEGNQFSSDLSSIVQVINDFPALTEFLLYDNQITGTIPPELANITTLTDIQLSNNLLTGSIPPELGNLPNLRTIHLDNNNLTGAIPSELGNITSLQELILNNNNLTGTVPPELASLNFLNTLVLSNNQLEDLPDLTDLFPLAVFQIENNLFSFIDMEPNVSLLTDPSQYNPQSPNLGVFPSSSRVDETDVLTMTVNESGGVIEEDTSSNTIYSWFNGQVLKESGPSPSITIPNFGLADVGTYSCVISNTSLPGISFLVDSIDLSFGKLLPPSDLNVISNDGKKIVVSWTDNSNFENNYEILRTEENSDASTASFLVTQNTTVYIDSLIAPNTTYFYQVRAVNGPGDDSDLSTGRGASISPVTALSKQNSFKALKIFPTPTKDLLQLEITGEVSGVLEILLTSVEGKETLRENLEINKNNLISLLDITELPEGMYFLTARLNHFVFYTKILKVK